MISCLDQFERLASRQDLGTPFSKPAQILRGHESSTGIGPDEFFHRPHSITGDGWKNLLRDGEDPPTRFARKAVVEDSDLMRAGSVALGNERDSSTADILVSLSRMADQF